MSYGVIGQKRVKLVWKQGQNVSLRQLLGNSENNINTHLPPGFVAGGWQHLISSSFHFPAVELSSLVCAD